ncbi:MAG: Gfo/Idh/MocA family oxidoreductase [Pseudomonadota bacterium]
MRIGLVGLGDVAVCHLLGCAQLGGVTVVAGADVNEQQAVAMAQAHGFKPYANHRDMLERETLDLLLVLTPASHHLAPVVDALERGLHVLCEKPLAASMEDALAIKYACASHPGKLIYGSVSRYLPTIQRARDMILGGAIGAVRLVTESIIGGSGLENALTLSAAHYPTGAPGGTGMGLMDHGIHLVDIVPWMMDTTLVGAFARSNRTGEPLVPEYFIADYANGASLHLLYDDEGTFATDLPGQGLFNARYGGWASPMPGPIGHYDPSPGHINVYGSEGALRIYHYANHLFHFDAGGVHKIPVDGHAMPDHFARQIEHCRSVIETGATPSPGIGDGFRALEIVYRALGAEAVLA